VSVLRSLFSVFVFFQFFGRFWRRFGARAECGASMLCGMCWLHRLARLRFFSATSVAFFSLIAVGRVARRPRGLVRTWRYSFLGGDCALSGASRHAAFVFFRGSDALALTDMRTYRHVFHSRRVTSLW
jgi:hypothetical protein